MVKKIFLPLKDTKMYNNIICIIKYSTHRYKDREYKRKDKLNNLIFNTLAENFSIMI